MKRTYNKGDRIGNWLILGRLGAGAMGIVYDVEHRVTGKQAALKVLTLGGKNAGILSEKMLDEARLLATQKCDHLVDVYDAGDGTGEHGYWMVMEKLVGRELREIIDEAGPLSLARALGYAEQIASAATTAHRAGVVHRDLKPANIHVSQTEVLKVIDFGVSQFRKGRTLNKVIGTVPYMSPEQLRKADDLDGRSDIYALGLILHEMLTGKQLFKQQDGSWLPTDQVLYTTLSANPVSTFEDVDARVRPLLVRATQKDRDQRYRSMDSIAADLHALKASVAHAYAPTARLSDAAVSAASQRVETEMMSTAAGAAVAKASAQATEQPARAIPGYAMVAAAVAALVVGMLVVVLLMRGVAAPPAPAATPSEIPEMLPTTHKTAERPIATPTATAISSSTAAQASASSSAATPSSAPPPTLAPLPALHPRPQPRPPKPGHSDW